MNPTGGPLRDNLFLHSGPPLVTRYFHEVTFAENLSNSALAFGSFFQKHPVDTERQSKYHPVFFLQSVFFAGDAPKKKRLPGMYDYKKNQAVPISGTA